MVVDDMVALSLTMLVDGEGEVVPVDRGGGGGVADRGTIALTLLRPLL